MTEFNLAAIAASVGVLGLAIAGSLSVYRDVIVRMLSASLFSELDARQTERIILALIISLLVVALASISAAVVVQLWPKEQGVIAEPADPSNLDRPEGILSASQLHDVANNRCLLFTYDRSTLFELPGAIAERMLEDLIYDTAPPTYRPITIIGQTHSRLDRSTPAMDKVGLMLRRAATGTAYLVDRFGYPASSINQTTGDPRADAQEFGPYFCGARIVVN
ncbi:hypothetical protein [Maricaulis maris]|uniref:hypothetical protein n=1 Tax=Maricaulis maris TaxID=74318 RepID=UPI0011C44C72|nr:hypothetical protein [Maricaulis maris]